MAGGPGGGGGGGFVGWEWLEVPGGDGGTRAPAALIR